MSKSLCKKKSRKRVRGTWGYRLLILILFTSISYFFFTQNSHSISTSILQTPRHPSEHVQPAETFILNWMMNPNGTLKTNLQPHESTLKSVSVGADSLSESLGLWMLYTVEKGDFKQFNQAYFLLQQYYLSNKGTVLWKISHNNPKETSTNALIDDLRIIEALMNAAELWGNQEYTDTAKLISKSIKKFQLGNNHLFTNFFDSKMNIRSQTLTLSYLNPTAIETMYELEVLKQQVHQSTQRFLKNIPNPDIFYPKSIDIKTREYLYDEEINLVDQVYIAYHQAKMGYINSDFYSFITEEFSKHGVLYGRYHRSSKTPAVQYESPALYGLTILYAIEANDFKFAEQLYYQMIQHQTLNPDKPYYGGFIDYSKNDTHIFDNLLPLLAERILFNEGIIQ